MNLFDYLYACSGWQWVGNIALVVAVFGWLPGWFTVRVYRANPNQGGSK